MTKPLRTFIAIEMDQTLKDLACDAQNVLKMCDCHVKWVEPQNIHLTLKFLGNTSPDQIEPIKERLTHILKDQKAIESRCTGLGTFPEHKSPRVIWLGLSDEEKHIQSIAKLIDRQMNKLGFEKEKRSFKPHLTLGRFRSPKNSSEILNKINDYELEKPITIRLNRIILFKSDLTPQGSVYQPLLEVPLS